MRKTHGPICILHTGLLMFNVYVVYHHHFDGETKRKAIAAILK